MKKKAMMIGCYALFILIGGIIGYVVANSLPSLIASTLFALTLAICTALVWRGSLKAYYTAMLLVSCLLTFFTYRFFLTYKLMPAGIMALISGLLFIYLFAKREQLAPN